jgi:uncharacterized damage-inducible protein DinB
MKKVFEAMATYNRNVNLSVLEIVEKLDGAKVLAVSKAYFPTIADQLSHILQSDIAWFKRLNASLPGNPVLASSRFVTLDTDAMKKEIAGDYRVIFGCLREIDVEILALVKGLDDAVLERVISYKNYKGEQVSVELWKILLQWLNHATHHRGSISAQLDTLGVENDFSAVLPRI